MGGLMQMCSGGHAPQTGSRPGARSASGTPAKRLTIVKHTKPPRRMSASPPPSVTASTIRDGIRGSRRL